MTTLQLYWVTTEDHCEDWFIVAGSAKEAEQLHAQYEGYDDDEAMAEQVVEVPEGQLAEKGWPPETLLDALGAKFIAGGFARVVEIGGRRFCEGLLESTIRTLDDDISESMGRGRINETHQLNKH